MNNMQLLKAVQDIWDQYKKAQVGRTKYQSFDEYLKERMNQAASQEIEKADSEHCEVLNKNAISQETKQ